MKCEVFRDSHQVCTQRLVIPCMRHGAGSALALVAIRSLPLGSADMTRATNHRIMQQRNLSKHQATNTSTPVTHSLATEAMSWPNELITCFLRLWLYL